jgi:hypothetical protein
MPTVSCSYVEFACVFLVKSQHMSEIWERFFHSTFTRVRIIRMQHCCKTYDGIQCKNNQISQRVCVAGFHSVFFVSLLFLAISRIISVRNYILFFVCRLFWTYLVMNCFCWIIYFSGKEVRYFFPRISYHFFHTCLQIHLEIEKFHFSKGYNDVSTMIS